VIHRGRIRAVVDILQPVAGRASHRFEKFVKRVLMVYGIRNHGNASGILITGTHVVWKMDVE
jgi:hypothetical protein